MNIIVTGSSGFVGKCFCNLLSDKHNLLAFDIVGDSNTNYNFDVSTFDFMSNLNCEISYNIVNLFSLKSDFLNKPDDYYKINVEKTIKFLDKLNNLKINHFIHISSVASFDGKNITYNKSLSLDDSYRSTKYLQEKEIINWAKSNNINLTIIYPSAISNNQSMLSSNIGKLFAFVQKLNIFIDIPVTKSTTDLYSLVRFINTSLHQKKYGKYLTLNWPIKTVTQICTSISNDIFILKIPFIKHLLYFVACVLEGLFFFLKKDPLLTRNRVTKLFSDTSYKGKVPADVNLVKFYEN